jgi:hypothetical protein
MIYIFIIFSVIQTLLMFIGIIEHDSLLRDRSQILIGIYSIIIYLDLIYNKK